ncbi:MAG: hypothetical protein GX872_07840, partial [Firmicutes bacterium]|nr:hypothetical protein [Bacillota bacterium]
MRNRKAYFIILICVLAPFMVLCMGLPGAEEDLASAGQSDYELLARVISG